MGTVRFLVVLALLAVLAGLVVWWLGGSPPPGEASLHAPTQAPAAEPPVPVPVGAEAAPPVPAREEVVSAPTEALAPGAEEPRDRRVLRGRVIVIDRDGSELTDADGRLVLGVFRRRATGRAEQIEFVDGTWSLTVDEIATFDGISVESLHVGTRPAVVGEPAGRVTPDFEQELVVRARLSPPTILRVVDAESGQDLDGVDLVLPARYPREDDLHPGIDQGDREIGHGLRSPIVLDEYAADLERPGSQTRLLVGASFHAFTLVELDLQRGGERVVSLEPGAKLEVTVRGVDPQAPVLLRLRSPERYAPVAQAALERDATLELADLAAGGYRVTAEVGDWFGTPIVLAEAQVELFAGKTSELDLVLEAPPVLETADAAGTVWVPEAWRARRVRLALGLLGPPLAGSQDELQLRPERVESARAGYDAFRWSREGLQVGRWELTSIDPPYSAIVELPAGGRYDLDLEVPPPIELHVDVIDDISGEEVASDGLSWFLPPTEELTGKTIAQEKARRDPQGWGYLIRAPAGEIVLHFWSEGYQPYNSTVDLGRGVREYTVRLQRACGLVLKLLDGETPIAPPEGWHGQGAVMATEGAGKVTGIQIGGVEAFGLRFTVSEPGTYSIQPPPIPGYLPSPLQTIEVLPGEFSEVVVELEREH